MFREWCILFSWNNTSGDYDDDANDDSDDENDALQILYGDYNEEVHGAGFLKDKLTTVLPNHMIVSRRRVECERKVLARYSEMSQYGFEDVKVATQ